MLVLVVFFVVALVLAAQSQPTSYMLSVGQSGSYSWSLWVTPDPPSDLRGSAQPSFLCSAEPDQAHLLVVGMGWPVVGAGQPCPRAHQRCRLRPVFLGRVVLLLLDASVFLLLLGRVHLLLLGRVLCLLLGDSVLLLLLGRVLLLLLGRVLLLLL